MLTEANVNAGKFARDFKLRIVRTKAAKKGTISVKRMRTCGDCRAIVLFIHLSFCDIIILHLSSSFPCLSFVISQGSLQANLKNLGLNGESIALHELSRQLGTDRLRD